MNRKLRVVGDNMKICEWCNLTDKEKEWLLFESEIWSIYLADIQDYVGRCILVLNRHCESISELNLSEWIELKAIINKLEQCYRELLGAELCNWSCLMNDFYKALNPNPHLHIHVRPRLKNPIKINSNYYEDTEFGHHYALKKDVQLIAEDKVTLYESMKKFLNS